MKKSIDAGHVETVPNKEIIPSSNAWWLPAFPVEQVKENIVRLVYDASAKHWNVSLNNALLQEPDINNDLRGILIRFREHSIGFISDIESMFNSSMMPTQKKEYHRFFLFDKKKLDNDIVQFRCTTHVFGRKSSPAVPAYGLQYTTTHPQATKYYTASKLIHTSFYVDDEVSFAPTAHEAIKVI